MYRASLFLPLACEPLSVRNDVDTPRWTTSQRPDKPSRRNEYCEKLSPLENRREDDFFFFLLNVEDLNEQNRILYRQRSIENVGVSVLSCSDVVMMVMMPSVRD